MYNRITITAFDININRIMLMINREVAEAISVNDNRGIKQSHQKSDDRDLYGGLIKLHILYHATHESIFGMGIMDELARHGYKLSAGTIYPMLHSMEHKGYLKSKVVALHGRQRRTYTITPAGKKSLAAAKLKVKELFGELFEDEPAKIKTE